MKRRLAIVVPLLIALSGCASAENYGDYFPPQPLAHASLLFDAVGGYPTATQMASRSDWPSTRSLYVEPEVVYYRETLYDRQGSYPGQHDQTYRRFDLVKEGYQNR